MEVIDNTGMSNVTIPMQSVIDSYATYAIITIPSGIYKIGGTINLKEGQTLIANNDVIIIGIGTNLLVNATYKTTIQGIEFQNCSTAINLTGHSAFNVVNCRFTNNIVYSAINLYNCLGKCNITGSYFNNILKYGILIDNNSSDITIEGNCFDNEFV